MASFDFNSSEGQRNLCIALVAVVLVFIIVRWARKNCYAGPFNPATCKEKFTDGCSGVMSPAAEAELAALLHLGAHSHCR